jgi:hypothetical protein
MPFSFMDLRPRTPGLRRICLALALAVASPVSSLRALEAAESALLREAQSHLQKFETNLNLALQSAGPGAEAVPPSKARLAVVRLQSALDAMAQVKARLDRLPGQDAAVEPVLRQFATLTAAAQGLRARLTGGAAPSAAAPASPVSSATTTPVNRPAAAGAGASATPRLDYRQQEELKNARFYLREVEGKVAALEQLVAQVKPVSDVTTLDFRLLQRGMNTVAEARQRAGLVGPRLANLPATADGVAEAGAELKTLLTRLDTAEQALQPLHARLAALVDPKSHPTLAADTARIRELAAMFSDPLLFQSHRPHAAARVRELASAQAEHKRVLEAYAALLRQTTAESTALTAASAHFGDRVGLFTAEMNTQRASLPGSIDADFQKIDRMVQEAVSNQKPAFFTDGIPFELGLLEEKLDLLDALEPARTAANRMKAVQGLVKKQQVALREAIIAANELPRDEFQGGERDEIVKLATEAWRKLEPGATVIAVRIPSSAWRRDTRWRNQTGDWYKIDRSFVQAQVIVRHSDTLAVIRPVDLGKNHLEGDRITAAPMDALKDELMPHRFLLLKRVR